MHILHIARQEVNSMLKYTINTKIDIILEPLVAMRAGRNTSNRVSVIKQQRMQPPTTRTATGEIAPNIHMHIQTNIVYFISSHKPITVIVAFTLPSATHLY